MAASCASQTFVHQNTSNSSAAFRGGSGGAATPTARSAAVPVPAPAPPGPALLREGEPGVGTSRARGRWPARRPTSRPHFDTRTRGPKMCSCTGRQERMAQTGASHRRGGSILESLVPNKFIRMSRSCSPICHAGCAPPGPMPKPSRCSGRCCCCCCCCSGDCCCCCGCSICSPRAGRIKAAKSEEDTWHSSMDRKSKSQSKICMPG
mmetsp:Transcript_5764/g.21954  ORF Transcript_5764/g.21954 Transcript_5764/m.21954 type:complete len:207 (+) Transcript_5764:308-928(+)